MKLSEAIRLGAMMNPKGIGFLRDSRNRTCALGAACEAVGIHVRREQIIPNNAMFRKWPMLRTFVKSPVVDIQRPGLASVSVTIQSLNDTARWTREEIADFVETLESRSTEQATPPPLDAVVPVARQPMIGATRV